MNTIVSILERVRGRRASRSTITTALIDEWHNEHRARVAQNFADAVADSAATVHALRTPRSGSPDSLKHHRYHADVREALAAATPRQVRANRAGIVAIVAALNPLQQTALAATRTNRSMWAALVREAAGRSNTATPHTIELARYAGHP